MIFVLVSLTFSFSRRTCNRGKMIISKVPDAKCIRNPCLLPLLACLFLKPPSKSLSLSDPVNHQLVPPPPSSSILLSPQTFLEPTKIKRRIKMDIHFFFKRSAFQYNGLGLIKIWNRNSFWILLSVESSFIFFFLWNVLFKFLVRFFFFLVFFFSVFFSSFHFRSLPYFFSCIFAMPLPDWYYSQTTRFHPFENIAIEWIFLTIGSKFVDVFFFYLSISLSLSLYLSIYLS